MASLSRKQFETLAMAELDPLYRLARRLTHDASKAEDLVQDTIARALKSRDGFELRNFGMKAWLLRMMYNLHLNRAMRERRQPAAVSDESLESGAAYKASDRLPIDPNGFQAMDERLVHALDALSEDYRAILLLWAVEELSYKEIAATLDVPIGTVMSRLYRARHLLAEELRPLAAEQGIGRE